MHMNATRSGVSLVSAADVETPHLLDGGLTMPGNRTGTTIAIKEHRRFVEFASALQKHHYIGIGFGPAGVGKMVSARRFARRDKAEPLQLTWGPRDPSDAIA